MKFFVSASCSVFTFLLVYGRKKTRFYLSGDSILMIFETNHDIFIQDNARKTAPATPGIGRKSDKIDNTTVTDCTYSKINTFN